MPLSRDEQNYHELLRISRKAKLLSGIGMLLEWDQETGMPDGASQIRSEQIELIARLNHEAKTSIEFKDALCRLIDLETGQLQAPSLNGAQHAALRMWRRDYIKAQALPTVFVEKYAKLTSEAMHVWRAAKTENRFSLFQPYLEQVIQACREKAEYLGYLEHPYDALLDEYEPGFTTQEIQFLFGSLKTSILSLLESIPQPHLSLLDFPISPDRQSPFLKNLLNILGFDWNIGRLDASAHPFSSSCHPTDNRITIRAQSDNLIDQILTTLHEAGHSFYEMGLPPEEYGSPLCEPISLGIHESQSRWWETLVGRSKPFWMFLYPQLQKAFSPELSSVSLDIFLKHLNQVERSFIRTQADEVTYPLHVILRFEIEKELIEGQLLVQEVPERWNTGMQELLGITPPNDTLGCLQDIHWSMGSFGYFPTYSLGNVIAAQLFHVFTKHHPQWDHKVSFGEFGFMREWLKRYIHSQGRRYNSKELVQLVSGHPINSEYYIRYLNGKYNSM